MKGRLGNRGAESIGSEGCCCGEKRNQCERWEGEGVGGVGMIWCSGVKRTRGSVERHIVRTGENMCSVELGSKTDVMR